MPFGSCKESAWEKEQRGEGGLEEEDYLFRQPGGDSRVPGTFTFRFKKILREGNLPDNLNVHSLRHTNASMLIAQGVDVRTVAGLLGHATAQHHIGHLQPCFRQEQKARTGEAGRGDGTIEEKEKQPSEFRGLFWCA